MTSPPSYARFFRAFALLLVAGAAISSLGATLHFAWGLHGFGGLEYLPRVLALSATREYAPGVSFSVALVAWLIQTHAWDEASTRSRFRPLAWRAALCSLLGYFPCLAVMLTVGILLSSFLYGIETSQFVDAARKTVFPSDLFAGARASLLELVPLLAVGYLVMPRFAVSGWRLGTKIVVLWLGMVALRFVAELASAMVALVAA